jgi:hypothetical protein
VTILVMRHALTGKGACNRSSAVDIKRALESNNSMKGVVLYVVEGVPNTSTEVPRITEISLLHNFEYDPNRLRVRKAFNIGKGKLLKWDDFDKNVKCFLQEFSVVFKR